MRVRQDRQVIGGTITNRIGDDQEGLRHYALRSKRIENLTSYGM